MSVSIVRDPRFAEHDPGPGHPECPERYLSISRALDAAEDLKFHDIAARAATLDEMTQLHHRSYLEQIEELRGQRAMLDPDTHTSEGSIDAAYLAAGSAIDLAVAVAQGSAPPGLALGRPPGHHAMPGRAMGFCFMNNIAAAAQALLDRGDAERVAIYDWDVHHGNGTQAIFYDEPRVLYMSTHQWPFYPGSGAQGDTGRGDGEGSTLNMPLPEGSTEKTLLQLTHEVMQPRLRDFSPDFILISAGFDALDTDPVGGFNVTQQGFSELALRWRDLAETLCKGRIAGVLEGGYDTEQLGSSVLKVLRAWNT